MMSFYDVIAIAFFAKHFFINFDSCEHTYMPTHQQKDTRRREHILMKYFSDDMERKN